MRLARFLLQVNRFDSMHSIRFVPIHISSRDDIVVLDIGKSRSRSYRIARLFRHLQNFRVITVLAQLSECASEVRSAIMHRLFVVHQSNWCLLHQIILVCALGMVRGAHR